MPKKLIIVPGLGNSGELHWQTLWESMFPFAKRVIQNTWHNPSKDEWVNGIENTVAESNSSGIYVVAHSLGCHAFAHWAYSSKYTVAGALLVAPPDLNSIENRNLAKGFSPLPIQKFAFKSIVVASSNDPYASLTEVKSYADQWGSWFINIGNKGHINADSGIGFWPEGLKILHSLTSQKQILAFA